MDKEQLYRDNERLVWFTIYKYYPMLATNEDIVQEGRIGLWKAIQSYRPKTKFSTYAVTLIHNEIAGYLRTENRYLPGKNKAVTAICSLDDMISMSDGDKKPVSEFLAAPDTVWRDWSGFVNALTKKEKETVFLFLQGLKKSEIAEKCGVSRQAVDARFYYIREKFNDYI